ncbi:MAG TPA: response regulator transcription factor [Clostridiales bacterium]|nr:response regulator transcription factor [Clostridiales bacterium]
MERAKILVVDDESLVRRLIARVLNSEGMQVSEAKDGPEAIRMATENDYDLIILDIMMDGMDGFQVIQELRARDVYTPIFVLSGRQQDNDQVFALGIGADDYVTKPFSPSILCAKVRACLRRVRLSERESDSVIQVGPFTYIGEEMRLQKNGKDIELSSKEFFLIKYFLNNIGKVLTKEQIYQNVWGDNVVGDNTIMVHIRRLRSKIEDDPDEPRYIRTVRGVGYQFVVDPQDE